VEKESDGTAWFADQKAQYNREWGWF